ncbi:MAG: hypothetical protein A4E32_01559 [Methanomassiliicoccales archaeon PtaU1.Bin124]|nr:MAG: hypothetical protein A4E32_01559 [Methanomassiliicoccales archaeon PtaU1.Bin124]
MTDDLVLPVDEAHLTALGLSTHILEYANAYRLISAQPKCLGRQRLRYVNLLLMFDELGKLMEIMKDCERAVTQKDPYVTVEGFFGRDVRSQNAMDNILRELGKSETLSILFKKVIGKAPSNTDFDSFKKQFQKSGEELDTMLRHALLYDIRERTAHEDDVPEEAVMDMYFEAVAMNAEAAREFIFEWARAKELDLDIRLKAIKAEPAEVKLWTAVAMPKTQRNF